MNFYEEWVEQDLNPIISFSSTSKITYSNQEAQFLLSRIDSKELYDLAVQYAPNSFGSQTSYIDLSLKNYTFYAITVMYENEDEIHMKLYKSAMVKKESKLNISNINITNIFSLTDLAISTYTIKSNTNFIKTYDPSIPEFKVDSNMFIKTLNLIFEAFETSEELNCIIKLKTGEYIKINGKKYNIVCVEITSFKNANLEKLSYQEESSFILNSQDNKISIDLPLIT